ncbi:MAG: glycosyltransferase family 39 protein [Anaerolineae bacterium]|nr:glycosyltransferase family 39 protein [Anaerolineae bacterium]
MGRTLLSANQPISKENRLTSILLTLILLIAAGFRLYGLRWEDSISGYPHPDERHLANTMQRISIPPPTDWAMLNDPDHSPLNPRRLIPNADGEHYDLAYGTLPVYLYRAVAVVLSWLTGDPTWDSHRAFGVIGRMITALFSLLTVAWAYRMGRRAIGVPAALLGAALLAACVLHIQLSHFMTVDLLMSAMLTAGLLFGVRFAQGGQTGDAIGMGLMLGLGMASKFNGITLGAGIAAAYIAAWLGGRRSLKDLLAYCVPLTVLFWAVSFATFEYYALRDPYTYAHAIGVQAKMVSGETDWPYTRQYVNTAPYLFQLQNLVVWGMGWPLGVAAVAGAIVSALGLGVDLWRARRSGPAERSQPPGREGCAASALPLLRRWASYVRCTLRRWSEDPRRAGLLVMLGWAIPFFAYTARLEVKFLRYMLPLTPVLCLLAGDLLWRGSEWLAACWRRAWGEETRPVVLRWGLPTIVLLPTVLWALAYVRVYAQEHPWQAASRWFYEHAPPGSSYTWEAWGDRLPVDLPQEDLYRASSGLTDRDVWMHIYHDMIPEEKLGHIVDSLRRADYVILSTPRLYQSVIRLPWRYPVEIRYYQLLFSERLGYELAAKFTAFPGLGSLEVIDLEADQSFYDYEHPVVLIYRKTRDLTDLEWRELFAEQLSQIPQVTREGKDPPVHLPIP